MRDSVLEYFVDKIYLHEYRLVVTFCYSEDKREVPMEVLNGGMEDLFAEGEAVEFDCPPSFTNAITPLLKQWRYLLLFCCLPHHELL